jgi:hypothetical protein
MLSIITANGYGSIGKFVDLAALAPAETAVADGLGEGTRLGPGLGLGESESERLAMAGDVAGLALLGLAEAEAAWVAAGWVGWAGA